MVAAAVAALGAVAGALPWPAFSQLLGRFLRLLAAHGEEKKVRAQCWTVSSVRLLCGTGSWQSQWRLVARINSSYCGS